MRNNLNKNIKVNELYTANSKTCVKLNLKNESISEFWQALRTLDGYGLINYSESKQSKLGKVSLKLDIEEIKGGLNSAKVFKPMKSN